MTNELIDTTLGNDHMEMTKKLDLTKIKKKIKNWIDKTNENYGEKEDMAYALIK